MPETEHVWGGLMLAGGRLSVELARICDVPPSHGRVMAFDRITSRFASGFLGGQTDLEPGVVAHRVGSDCRLIPAWNTKLGARAVAFFSSATVANGVVCVGTAENSGLAALDARTGDVLWSVDVAGAVYTPPAVVNGRVFAVSWDQRLYAFGL